MPNPKVRVDIPSDPTAKITLLKMVKAKHEQLAENSPLKGLKWETLITPALARAETADQLSDELRRKREKATGERDVEMPTVTEALRSARDVLLGLNRDNPDALGDFGFDVADATSSPPSTPRPAK
jgi:phytoene dehydrogenase-like protein